MSRKTEVAYKAVFKYINEKVLTLVGCESFTTDYELAMRNALRALDPNARMITCLFHLCQAVKKRAWQTAGLAELIKTNKNIRSIYYRLQCLAILPAIHIRSTFRELWDEASKLNESALMLLLEYFNNQWLVSVCLYST